LLSYRIILHTSTVFVLVNYNRELKINYIIMQIYYLINLTFFFTISDGFCREKVTKRTVPSVIP